MYQNGLQMSNYCAQLPPHTRLYIHGRPQIQKSPYGYTQGPTFIVFQNARIQTIFEDVKKTYFKFNQITMRPAYNGEELFFEQNKSFLKNLLFLRQTIVINFPKNWVFQKIIGVPKFCSKINGEFCFGAFCELLQGLEVQNKSNTMRTPLWPLGKEFRRFQRVVHSKLSIWRHNRSFDQFFWAVLASS